MTTIRETPPEPSSSMSAVLINGRPSDGTIPVTDSAVLRGDGCFEVIKTYEGEPFRLADHLERLENSARLLDIDLPPREEIAGWVEQVAKGFGDGVVRILVTRGSNLPGEPPQPLVITFAHTWTRADAPARFLPVVAPWHGAGVDWELAGAKILSYAPNMAATRRAHKEGFEDALLLTTGGLILEGPTFSVGWVVDGKVETPSLSLGILDSITRRVLLELASDLSIPLAETESDVARLDDAQEVFALSTVREFQPVVVIGDREFAPGPITELLGAEFARRLGNRSASQLR